MRFRLMIAAALLLAPPALAEVAIGPGEAAMVRLSPQGELAYPVPLGLPRAPANFGAILAVEIDEPGRYHVALGAPGRIDMVRDGVPLIGTGQHAGAGSGSATITDFDLDAGRYTLALSGMTAGEVSVAISR